MKKVSYSLAALALLAAIGFKVAADLPQKPTYLGRPVPTATTTADAVANGVCRGTLTAAAFAPDMGITQADVESYAKRYKDEARTCDELTYLGNVDYGDGRVDYIYRMRITGKALWYIFTIADGKVTNVQ